MKKFMGIDLGSKTGICVLNQNCKFSTVGSDEEILAIAAREKPALIAIDAPLSLPRKGYFRWFEKKLLKRGFKLLPIKDAMLELAKRGMRLRKKLLKFRVIEVHPTSSARILGARFPELRKAKNQHERSAFYAALTAKLAHAGLCFKFGKLYLPRAPMPSMQA